MSILLHTFSMILSLSIFILIVYRWNYNRLHHRHHAINSISVFDDSIALLLIGNTYFTFIIYSATWLSILIHTLPGDFSIFTNFLYLDDSTGCRIRVAMIFFLTSAFFHSFLLQALWSYIKVKFHSTLHSRKIYCFRLNLIFTYVLLIIITWIISGIILIPAFKAFDVFVYFPEQYHCLISFTNIRGFTYSLLSTYIIPVSIIILIYIRLVHFTHYASNFNRKLRAKREIRVVKHILTICGILSFSGLPTILFVIHFMRTGKIHPLGDRVHELCLAINTNIVTIGCGILNSLTQFLSVKSTIQDRFTTNKKRLRNGLNTQHGYLYRLTINESSDPYKHDITETKKRHFISVQKIFFLLFFFCCLVSMRVFKCFFSK